MRAVGVLWLCLASLGCGRVAFDDVTRSTDDGATGDGAVVLHCTTLSPSCGPAGNEPCCSSMPVPGGTFVRSFDVGTDAAHTDTTHAATVSAFRLDRYEVTVGRFREFVNAGMGTQQRPPAAGAGGRTLGGGANEGGWSTAWNTMLAADTAALVADSKCSASFQTWTDAPGANEAFPINCVSWYEAMAFCIWDGGYLPTEAEWNYASTGGNEQRAYPWSNPASSVAIDCAHANHFTGSAYCVSTGSARVGGTSPAGDGKWGHADLAGNLSEWTLDLQAVYADPCDDCAQLQTGTLRVVRGGNFGEVQTSSRTAYRTGGAQEFGFAAIGFRCARAP